MDVASTERENRWRLEQVLLVCVHPLQQRTQKAWDASTKADKAALAKSLPPFQRSLVTGNVAIDSWDISQCNAVLKHFGALKKKDAKAVAAIVGARNHSAHVAGGRVTTAMFKQHTNACEQALKTLGGDVVALQKLLTNEIDANDAGVLTSSPEATALAEAAKLEGNRLFREGDFRGARKCYTRGLQVPGVVDPVVMSYLYNNRATASIRLKEFGSAKEDAKHAAELAPHRAKPHVRLAEIYHETYKPEKAVARLEMALGYATAANDTACIKEVNSKMAEYRLERDQATRRESENLAYGTTYEAEGPLRAATQARQGLDETRDPMDLLNAFTSMDLSGTGLQAKKHVLLAQQARTDGRLADAAREFMAAAVAGDPEGMYNYALYQLKGRGTRKNIPEAVRWLEKAASMQIDDSPMKKLKNVGIGEAMGMLGNLYDGGVHFPQDKTRAREYWERSAALGVNIGLSNFGLCLMNGTHGVKKDLPRARELFRRSAECLHNEAMSNIAAMHAALLDYETAARWSDAAAKYGYLPAAALAEQFRELAKARAPMPEDLVSALKVYNSRVDEKPTTTRQNETPSIDELRAIGTPYGNRLLAAKEMIAKAMKAPRDVREMASSVLFAVQANRIEDSGLVFSKEESVFSSTVAATLLYAGVPVNAGIALLTKPTDPSSAVAFWTSLQRQFPEDLAIAKRAACMLSFEAYPGHDFQRALQLFQRAFSLLPNPDDDSDPHTLDLLYLTGVAYYHISDFSRAETMLTRFLAHASADGHRKASEATYFMGEIAMVKLGLSSKALDKVPRVAAKYLEHGDRLLQQIPAFLRDAAGKSPHRATLQRISSLPGGRPATSTPAASEALPASHRRGGELIDGPRRLQELRSDTPTLQKELRANIAAMAMARVSLSGFKPWSTPPARKPATKSRHRSSCTRATIDELFSAMEDRVYTTRVLNCIVVSLPSFNGSSYQFVVEDSQREPSRIALYNVPQSLIAQLTPGREFELRDPYVRLARDGSIMLRVDDPAAAIDVKVAHVICWVCSLEQTADQQPKRCAKCHKATYCSKECQTHDWRVDGHRVLCSVFANMNG